MREKSQAREMLAVEEALTLILGEISLLPSILVTLSEAVGRVLAEDVIAADSMPPFTNSSMDGYALRSADSRTASKTHPVRLKVLEDISAGRVGSEEVKPGSASRIMTGAPLPLGADAVIPVEDTSEPWRGAERPLPDFVDIRRPVVEGEYIRFPGEDIKGGDVVLESGHKLRPQEIGVLASLGISKVRVIQRPKVAVLATGDELISVDDPLTPGKIRNSNSFTQAAQVRQMGAAAITLGIAADSADDVRSKLRKAVESGANLIISSAGVSVGAHDVVKTVLDEEGAVKIWRVRMRPGKPLTYAYYSGIPYLGLPGNPVSAMVTFELFARPLILKMAGLKRVQRPRITVSIQEEIRSDGRQSYIRSIVSGSRGGYTARTTGKQGSHMLMSLVSANALVVIPEGVLKVNEGDRLEAIMLDWSEDVF